MSCTDLFPNLSSAIAQYPKPDVRLKYGTAGFRTKSEFLSSTFLRMGMLAALRSRKMSNSGVNVIGLMVTASHNLEPDNGIKLVDPDGGMLDQNWERHAMALANADSEAVCSALDSIVAEEHIDLGTECRVFVARDTRSSSEELSDLALQGSKLLGASVVDHGLLTTPQLHHIVRMTNLGNAIWASEAGYYSMLSEGYLDLVSTADDPSMMKTPRGKLIVDGAHGIGAPQALKMANELKRVLEARGVEPLEVEVRNDVNAGELNSACGAEYVQKGRVPPSGVDSGGDATVRICSLDGDADRVVFHFFDTKGSWHLLDGDKIAALLAAFLKQNFEAAGIADEFSMAAVQTAYANGASTRYIRGLGVDVPLAKTGVKYLHHKAVEYDVGLYFEANGHGTVVFKDAVLERLRGLLKSTGPDQPVVLTAVRRLLAASQLINQAVGDAISDFLLVEALLTLKSWSIEKWAATYEDLPSRQGKLAVADRGVVQCTEDETRTTAPLGLQDAIDEVVGKYSNGRAFVRPSGTEDVVRVYAEASTEDEANALAHDVSGLVFDLAGGVGERPVPYKPIAAAAASS